jgi:hypothetical protein
MTSRRCLPAVALVVLAGCQMTELGSLKSVSDKLAITSKEDRLKDSAYDTPARLIAIWSDAMYTRPGQTPTRGFGGRLYFYNAKDKTVPVEGQLVVYGYDDSKDGTPAKTPSRRFGFTPEQFTQHYSPTELGASYSVWIPWDELGGDRKSITLLPVFTSSSGHVVMGEQSINVLPGKAPENPEPAQQGYFTPLSSSEPQSVRPVAYNQPQAATGPSRDSWQQTHTYEPSAAPQTQLRATTIPLPMDMTRRLVQTANADTSQAATPAALTGSGSQLDGTPTGQAAGDQDTRASAVTEPALPTPPATRFVRPRSPAPRALASPPSPFRAATPPRPAGPQLAPPFPPAANPDSSGAGSAPIDSGHASWGR